MKHIPRLKALTALLAATVTLAGCASASPPSTSTTAAAEACPPPPSAPSTEADSPTVTPAELCALDGSTWAPSVFVTVLNTPSWGETTPACDDARKAAYYDAWQAVQSQMTTLELRADSAEDARPLGAVGIAVLPAPDATAPIALIDAEVAACIDASAQTRTERGPWHGVRGPLAGDDGEQLAWWAAGDGRWSLVQAYISDTRTAADAAAFESALETVLDAQAAHL